MTLVFFFICTFKSIVAKNIITIKLIDNDIIFVFSLTKLDDELPILSINVVASNKHQQVHHNVQQKFTIKYIFYKIKLLL